MTAVLILLGVAIVCVATAVVCSALVQIRLIRDIAALQKAQVRVVVDGRMISQSFLKYRREGGA